MGTAGMRPGKARGPFVGPGGSAPVPTISCGVAGGSPTTYAFDEFDRNMGWWTLAGTTEIAAGLMRVPLANTQINSNVFLLKSRALAGAEEATLIANLDYLRSDASTYGGGIRWGTTTNPFVGLTYQSDTGTTRMVVHNGVSLSSNIGRLYDAASPIANGAAGSFEVKIIAKVASTDYYFNGALLYTGAAIAITGAGNDARVIVARSPGVMYASATDFAYFGYNLPASC